ncbi:MAG: flavodoxin domain-containing protein [Spirochaetota bacterium]
MSKVLIVYHTFTGKTEKMARALAEGIRSVQGVEVILKKAADAGPEELASADAIAFGAPNTFGGMAGALREFFERSWPVHAKTAGKPAVAFTCEMPDQTGALEEIEKFFSFYGLKNTGKGVAAPGEVGEKELTQCKQLGQSLGQASKK